MILTLGEAKEWLRFDSDEDDATITGLIIAAETYLKNATGKQFDSTDEQAKLFCKFLVNDWYENRELTEVKPSEKIRLVIQSMLAQLTYGEGGVPIGI